jgi:error-prone DNA polymerase
MLAVDGRIQREGEVVHLVARALTDLSAAIATIGDRDLSFPLPHGRGDEFHRGGPGVDPRERPQSGAKSRDIYVEDRRLDTIKVKARDFR